MYDLLIKNGRIVTADGVTDGNIAIKGGLIAAVLMTEEEPEAARVIDAAWKYVFPGAIDTHGERFWTRDPAASRFRQTGQSMKTVIL